MSNNRMNILNKIKENIMKEKFSGLPLNDNLISYNLKIYEKKLIDIKDYSTNEYFDTFYNYNIEKYKYDNIKKMNRDEIYDNIINSLKIELEKSNDIIQDGGNIGYSDKSIEYFCIFILLFNSILISIYIYLLIKSKLESDNNLNISNLLDKVMQAFDERQQKIKKRFDSKNPTNPTNTEITTNPTNTEITAIDNKPNIKSNKVLLSIYILILVLTIINFGLNTALSVYLLNNIDKFKNNTKLVNLFNGILATNVILLFFIFVIMYLYKNNRFFQISLSIILIISVSLSAIVIDKRRLSFNNDKYIKRV
jgi:hypothetical protein